MLLFVDAVEQTTDAASLYLDLLKRSLTGALAEDNDSILGGVRTAGSTSAQAATWPTSRGGWPSRVNVEIVYKKPYDPALREVGRDWPSRAESMIGLRRMENIQHCVQTVLDDDVPGDLIEAGVWRGGACIFMKANLHVPRRHQPGRVGGRLVPGPAPAQRHRCTPPTRATTSTPAAA